MTAKEYLQQIRTLDIIIAQKRQELTDLHDIATAIGSFDYSKDRVQTSPNGEAPYARVAEKAAEIDDEIRRLTAQFERMVVHLEAICEDLLTPEEMQVVQLRYCQNRKWPEIAEMVGSNERTVYRRHDRALKKLEAQDVVV